MIPMETEGAELWLAGPEGWADKSKDSRVTADSLQLALTQGNGVIFSLQRRQGAKPNPYHMH